MAWTQNDTETFKKAVERVESSRKPWGRFKKGLSITGRGMSALGKGAFRGAVGTIDAVGKLNAAADRVGIIRIDPMEMAGLRKPAPRKQSSQYTQLIPVGVSSERPRSKKVITVERYY